MFAMGFPLSDVTTILSGITTLSTTLLGTYFGYLVVGFFALAIIVFIIKLVKG